MPGQHSNPTIAFRPTQWERAMIEERVKASGLYKKDFIARSCIYSNIVVVGTKQRVQYLVEELRETQIVMKEITEQILSGDFSMSEESYKELKEDYLAFMITMVDILNGAAYLFEKKPDFGKNSRRFSSIVKHLEKDWWKRKTEKKREVTDKNVVVQKPDNRYNIEKKVRKCRY